MILTAPISVHLYHNVLLTLETGNKNSSFFIVDINLMLLGNSLISSHLSFQFLNRQSPHFVFEVLQGSNFCPYPSLQIVPLKENTSLKLKVDKTSLYLLFKLRIKDLNDKVMSG